MKKFKLISLVFPTLLMAAGTSSAWAAPAVTNVAGNVQQGGQITISGSSFGATGPNVVLFDTFDKGTVGNRISTTTGSAAIGNWSSTSNNIANPTYSSEQSLNGDSRSMRIRWFGGSGQQSSGPELFFPSVGSGSAVTISWWQFMPSNRSVPGTSGNEGPNWKWYWLYDSSKSWGDNSDYVSTCLSNNNCDAMQGPYGSRSGASSGVWDSDWYDTIFKKGTWMRFTLSMKNATSGGWAWNQEISADRHSVPFDVKNIKTAASGHAWNSLTLPGYGRDDSNGEAFYDDVYVATGNGARARVEIGEAATYSSCKKLAILPTTAWSSTQVKATLHSVGQFKANDKVYLFVVDADGSTSPGYGPLTVGQSSGSAQSPAPTPTPPAPTATAPSGLNISER
jgi:hypothetical protein